ncbi:MAG: hypothetical protein OXN96_19155 [Bryobacterales bacterium]|nr:hypothetical protein [Bryobacterales bacterium]
MSIPIKCDPASGADDRTEILIGFPGSGTVQASIEPTTERDFEHLQNGRYGWLRLRCVETGLRSNQLISRDISLESVIHHARKLARAEPRPGEKR